MEHGSAVVVGAVAGEARRRSCGNDCQRNAAERSGMPMEESLCWLGQR